MKALSVKQPWAEMILSGKKTIEVRTWKTDYRGDLLICSSLRYDWNCANQAIPDRPYYRPHSLICGQALCVVNLIACRPFEWTDEWNSFVQFQKDLKLFAWILSDVKRIKPFPVKGKLKLFEVNYEFQNQN